LSSVGEYEKPCAFAEFPAGLVPQDCDDPVVVKYVVQAKPLPGIIRQQGVYFDDFVGPRAQSRQAGYYQIAIARMVVVLAAFFSALGRVPCAVFPVLQSCACDPVAGEGVQILVDPRDDTPVFAFASMAPGVDTQYVEIIGFCYHILVVVVEHIGHRRKRYRR